jgi:Xaa-Pro dipeptidase
MSKHDFTIDEFAARRERVRAAMGAAGLDWLVLFHPVSIHWLTGSDGKAYQEFQCLLLSGAAGPAGHPDPRGQSATSIWTTCWSTRSSPSAAENEDAVAVFQEIADSLGLRSARVGMEVPAYYLHPHDYAFSGSSSAARW